MCAYVFSCQNITLSDTLRFLFMKAFQLSLSDMFLSPFEVCA